MIRDLCVRLLPLALAAGGCLPPSPSASSAEVDAGSPVEAEPGFPCDSFVNAHSIVLVQRIDAGQLPGFARLSTDQTEAIDTLVERSSLRWEVQVALGRMLIRPPREHPLGQVELLLLEESGQMVVFLPAQRRRVVLPVGRLADLLEHGPEVSRSRFSLRLDRRDTVKPARGTGGGQLARVLGLDLRFRRQPPGPKQAPHRPLHARVELELMPSLGHAPFSDPLLVLALPWLMDRISGDRLGQVARRAGGRLVAWRTRLGGVGRDGRPLAATRTEVVAHRVIRLPMCALATRRPRRFHTVKVLPPARSPGRQLVERSLLKRLRSAEPGGPLHLANNTPATMLVYLDGAAVGVVQPSKKIKLSGISRGYYRVFARSLLGSYTYGPKDLYVPGTVTLD